MTGRAGYRESELPDAPPAHGDRVADGRRCISVIGIDRYRRWAPLNNAVGDARGALAAFKDLGFSPVVAPLLDDAATCDAIHRLPAILKPELDVNDSLVVFFAGHGHTVTEHFADGYPVSSGYLIPVDADLSRKPDDTWEQLELWLSRIAKLPPRHILVILDSCHSGIALSRDIQHRAAGARLDGAPVPVHERLSRRVLTSALDDQTAMDGGPIPGHSVFTGYLIEALRGGASAWLRDSSVVGVSTIAEYVRLRVQEHSGRRQVPALGLLEFDNSGELFLSLKQPRVPSPPSQDGSSETHDERAHRAEENRRPPVDPDRQRPSKSPGPRSSAERTNEPGTRTDTRRASVALEPRLPASATDPRPALSTRTQALRASTAQESQAQPGATDPRSASPESTQAPPTSGASDARVQPSPADPRVAPPVHEWRDTVPAHPSAEGGGLPDRTEGWILDPVLAAALDRQGEERRLGAPVLTVVAGDALAAQTSWGTWAARHGYLTLATQAVGLDAIVADLLAQTPWLRCVPEARRRLAAAARIDAHAVDASLDARSMSERRIWVGDIAPLDRHAEVSGWLLSWLRRSAAKAPDLTTAPVRPGELLAIACDLASPTAVLLFHPTPDEPWLERAVATAAELIGYLPAHSVAVTAPHELVTRVLGEHRRGTAWTMARQGLVSVEALAVRAPGRARLSTMRVLFDALARDPRTRGRFELDGKVTTADGPTIDVALVAHADRIAVELDAWYHFHDPEGYRRDRVQDTRLQRAGYFVLRFPAEDVDDRLASTIEHLAIALAGRRAVRALL